MPVQKNIVNDYVYAVQHTTNFPNTRKAIHISIN